MGSLSAIHSVINQLNTSKVLYDASVYALQNRYFFLPLRPIFRDYFLESDRVIKEIIL
jgi:hypothetical protein